MDRKELREELQKAKSLFFLGGAGISTKSGIPDFRSPEGLYQMESEYGVTYEEMLSSDYFYSHTETFYDYFFKHMLYPEAKPNRAHLALARFEAAGHDVHIATQNIDGLHQKAGSKKVYELHGNAYRYYCTRCAARYTYEMIDHSGVPHCHKCGGILKPAVTLYGEELPPVAMSKALEAVKNADFMIVAGTSLRVFPASALPSYFKGKASILINLEETPMDRHFDYVIREEAGKALEELLC